MDFYATTEWSVLQYNKSNSITRTKITEWKFNID